MKNTQPTLKVLLMAGLMLSVTAVAAYEGEEEADFFISGSDYVDEGIYEQENDLEADFHITGSDYADRQQKVAQVDDLEADFHISSSEYIKDRDQRNAEAAKQARGKVASR